MSVALPESDHPANGSARPPTLDQFLMELLRLALLVLRWLQQPSPLSVWGDPVTHHFMSV